MEGVRMHGSARPRVLIVDDDRAQSHFLSAHLMRRSYDVSSAATGDEAIRMFRVFDPALVLLDADARGMEGMETLERLKQIKPDVSVIMTASSGAPEMIFRASKLGADDFMAKPIDLPALDQRMARLLDGQRLTSEVTQLRDHVRRQSDGNMLFGTSPKMEDVKTTIEQVADTNATVLIRGESGTGKEVVARMVFSHSLRSEKPFVKVNCAAIPHELLESELFGYEPGAFTGANRQKLGKFDLAHGGTIFLDEISEMHPALQAKLLHVLQDGGFARLGGKRDISVDVRVLAATNKQLERAVEEGLFREDTPYRPNSPYSASKAASDHLVRAYHKTFSLPATISNCSNNYGPYQFPEKLIPLIVLNALEGKPLPVYGDGKNVRDWLYVEDHCEAIWSIMNSGRTGETYNVGGNAEIENILIVQMICDILDEIKPATDGKPRRKLITFVQDRPGHDRRYAIDFAKLNAELGWSPRESFKSGLSKTVEWYLNQKKWVENIKTGAYQSWIKEQYGS